MHIPQRCEADQIRPENARVRIYGRFDMRESDQCRYVEMPGISDKIADVEMRQISSRIRVLSMTHSFRVMFRPIAMSIQTAI